MTFQFADRSELDIAIRTDSSSSTTPITAEKRFDFIESSQAIKRMHRAQILHSNYRPTDKETIRPSNDSGDSSYEPGSIPALKMTATARRMQKLLPGALVERLHLLQLPDDIGH